MKVLIPLLALVALVVTAGGAGAADQAPVVASPTSAVSPAFEKDIRKLLEVTHAADMGQKMLHQVLAAFKPAFKDTPEEFWTKVEAKFNLEINSLSDLLVPVYARNLSPEDVKGLIQFYESPLGQRFVAVQPKMTAEAMVAGQTWGRALGVKVMDELQAERAKQAPKSTEAPAAPGK